ncbi:MAG: hypothetical protein Q9M13_05105, partial [Mariprofundales bacterium]|nr:hypothetical protein [Mariprofundales bacterium]
SDSAMHPKSPLAESYGRRGHATAQPVSRPPGDYSADMLQASMVRLERLVSGLERYEADELRLAIEGSAEREAFDRLLRKGVAPGFAAELAEDFAAGAPVGKREICWSESMDPTRKRTTLILTGPAGAGKTTLAAKLATHYSLKGVRVALLTTDAERMGGSDLFRSYAEALGAPFAVLRTIEDLPLALEQVAAAQLILVDSAGLTLHSTTASRQARQLWGGFADAKRVMVLPANLDEADGEALLAQSSALGVSHLAFSKLDETGRCGKIINWAIPSRLKLCYCTFGTDIPGQMGWLSPKSMTTLLAK